MKSTITFFPVDNGDMTLIKLIDKTTILIDITFVNLLKMKKILRSRCEGIERKIGKR